MKAVNARIAVAVDTSLLLDDPRTPHWRSFCKSYAVMGKSCRLPNIVGYPSYPTFRCMRAGTLLESDNAGAPMPVRSVRRLRPRSNEDLI